MEYITAWILIVSTPGGVTMSVPLWDQYSCEQLKSAVYGRNESSCVKVRLPATLMTLNRSAQ